MLCLAHLNLRIAVITCYGCRGGQPGITGNGDFSRYCAEARRSAILYRDALLSRTGVTAVVGGDVGPHYDIVVGTSSRLDVITVRNGDLSITIIAGYSARYREGFVAANSHCFRNLGKCWSRDILHFDPLSSGGCVATVICSRERANDRVAVRASSGLGTFGDGYTHIRIAIVGSCSHRSWQGSITGNGYCAWDIHKARCLDVLHRNYLTGRACISTRVGSGPNAYNTIVVFATSRLCGLLLAKTWIGIAIVCEAWLASRQCSVTRDSYSHWHPSEAWSFIVLEGDYLLRGRRVATVVGRREQAHDGVATRTGAIGSVLCLNYRNVLVAVVRGFRQNRWDSLVTAECDILRHLRENRCRHVLHFDTLLSRAHVAAVVGGRPRADDEIAVVAGAWFGRARLLYGHVLIAVVSRRRLRGRQARITTDGSCLRHTCKLRRSSVLNSNDLRCGSNIATRIRSCPSSNHGV